jgi:predicted dehydrogenase
MDIVLDYGMGRVILQSEVQEMKMTDWSFQVRRGDLMLDVTYPTTYAAAAPSSCTATYEKDGLTVEEAHGGRYETGFRCEWKHIHDVVKKGVAPLTSAHDAVKDLELAEKIMQTMVQQSEQGGAQ